MIDFNPEEQTITIPASYVNSSRESQSITGLQSQSTRNDCPSTLGNCYFACEKYGRERRTSYSSAFMIPKVAWSLRIPWPQSHHRRRERKFFLLPDQCTGIAGPTR